MTLRKIQSASIADNAITSDKIASGAVTASDIPNGEITAAKLSSTAISDKLGYTPANQTDIQNQINNLVAAAPGALDTLNELATALGNDPNFATTITNLLAAKLAFNDKGALIPTFSSDPTGVIVNGQVYFNTVTKLLRVYDGIQWNNVNVDLSPFSNTLSTSLAASGTNVTEAGSSKISTYGYQAIMSTDNSTFGWHDGHDGDGADFAAYWAVYLGSAKAVNRLQVWLHGNSFGYFELQATNNADTSGSFYNTGTWTTLAFDAANSSINLQNGGGNSSGYSDNTVLTFRYNNNIPYTHYRLLIKDTSRPNQPLYTNFQGWATYHIEMSRV